MFLKKISVDVYLIAEVFVCVCVCFLTLEIAPYYILGDQRSYINSYYGIAHLDFLEGFSFYKATLGSSEIVHYLLTKLSSGYGIGKDFLMAISNALLALLAMRLFEKIRASAFVAMAIVLSNFYMLVMYFSAERLKFGFIFLTLSILYLEQWKRFYILSVLAIISHVQVMLVYFAIYFSQLVKKVARFFVTLKISPKWVALPLIVLVPIAFLAEHISSKFEIYFTAAAEKDIFDLMRIFLLLLLSIWYSRNKSEVFLLFVPLILAAFLVGSDRVNMMAYFVFLYYGLQCKGGLNYGVLITTIYFALKSYCFIENVLEYGDGFKNM